MVKYLKTEVNAKLIEALLIRYINMNKYYVVIPNKLIKFLEENYKLNINYIISEMITNLRVNKVKKDLIQIFTLDKKIGETTLESLLQLVEYGNRDIPPSNCISKLLNKSLLQVKNYLGGL